MISSPLKNKGYYSPVTSVKNSPSNFSTRMEEKSLPKSLSPRKQHGGVSTFKTMTSNEGPKFTFLDSHEKGIVDHEIRDHKAKSIVADFMKTQEFFEFRDYVFDKKYESMHYVIPNTMKTMFEKIIGIYHIHITYLDVSLMDSAVEIVASSDYSNVNFLLGCLIPLFPTIPYTFYRKLKLNTINICEDMKLLNDSRILNFYQRLYGSWFFCLNVKEPEIVKRHFYNCICYNVMKNYDNFDEMWLALNPKETIDPLLVDESNLKEMKGFLNKESMASPLRDQFEHFYLLMLFPNKMLNHHDKIIAKKSKLMKDAMDMFDSKGITPNWWKQRGLYISDNKKDGNEAGYE